MMAGQDNQGAGPAKRVKRSATTPRDAPSRRQVLIGGLGASPIFLTLLSLPAWANHCAISGLISGNVSAPGTDVCVGLTPGFWKTHLSLWGCGIEPHDKFGQVFAGIKPKILPAVRGGMTLLQAISPDDKYSKTVKLATGIPVALWAHCVAGLLNACHFSQPQFNGYEFGYDIVQMKQMVVEGCNGDPARLIIELTQLNERGTPVGAGS